MLPGARSVGSRLTYRLFGRCECTDGHVVKRETGYLGVFFWELSGFRNIALDGVLCIRICPMSLAPEVVKWRHGGPNPADPVMRTGYSLRFMWLGWDDSKQVDLR